MWDAYGKEYLDFAAGIAVNSVGKSVGSTHLPTNNSAMLQRSCF